ncbi:MAG TPA: LolA-related protein [Pseudoxanthomonas sp.]|nr:LolA-related protein [Pseudoxanthomonas sp.]
MCSLALPCAAADGAALDSGWILQKLARPVPARTAFVELRGSALLKAPLRVEGEYRRPDATTLVREVRVPYAETTTIRDGQATVARQGRAPRRFALSRAPELATLQASFGALLAGDGATLERHYRLQPRGSRERWTLRMTPKDAGVARRLGAITLYGQGAELRCIETMPVSGELQRTLLAGAARDAATAQSAEALLALCRAAGAR